MKNIKKTLRITLLLTILICAFSVYVSANTYSYTYGDLTYSVFGGRAIFITDCSYSATSVTIPSTIKGFPVTYIRDNAFEGCDSLASIEIPSSVTSIASSAFYGCRSLVSVSFGENSELTSIGSSAFYGCDSLASIEIPSSVTSIGSSAFYGCDSLVSVSFGENSKLTSIGDEAFEGCDSLASMEIPSSVTSIGSSAFYGCDSLKKVNISDIEAWCKIDFDGFYSNPLYYAQNLYLNNVLVTDLIIPSSVTSIGDYSFSGCTKLTSVIIHDSITSISYYAFHGCNSLKDVYYYGPIEQWKLVFVGTGNEKFTIHYDVKAVINYDANGGTNAPYFQVINQGESGFVVSDKVPVKDGYGFLGWSTTSDGNVEFYPGDECQIAEDMFLYAVWVKTYNVSYNANGGYGAPSLQKKLKMLS